VAKLKLEIVTAEHLTFSGDVNAVIAPGIEGQLGILPNHAPLMTMLQPGELLIKKDGEELYLAITGGFLEVRPDKVIILADACERCEEIDISRAEAKNELKNVSNPNHQEPTTPGQKQPFVALLSVLE
jgi:F-type H+-transporting ATPase subunit epsilon